MIARLSEVTFTYELADTPALDSVSVDIRSSRITGLVGASGSGKSTLVAVIRSLVPSFHPGTLTGSVEVLGTPLLDWEPGVLSRRIGFAFQNPFTQLTGTCETVFEEMAFGLENLGVGASELVDRVLDVAEEVGITSLLDRDPRRLSGGQRQKVAFASVIAMDQEAYVFDEPTSQLDPDSAAEIFAMIAGLRDKGRTVILIEHDVDRLAEIADDIVVLHDGRVAAHGPAQDVLGDPRLESWGAERPEVTRLASLLEQRGIDIGRPVSTSAARVRLGIGHADVR